MISNNNLKLQNLIHFFVALIAGVVISTSLAMYLGMRYHIPLLSGIVDFLGVMKINTAVCFALAGVALLLINKKNHGLPTRILYIALVIIILALSSTAIFNRLTNFDSNTMVTERMAFVSSVNFILIGFALLGLLKKSKLIWLSQTMVWVSVVITLVAFFNYLYGAEPGSVYIKFTTIPLKNIALFMLINTGILLIHPDLGLVGILLRNNNSGYLLRRIIAIPILSPILLFQLGLYLQHERVLGTFTVIVITQVGILVLTGITTAIIAIILDGKEKAQARLQSELQYNEMIFQQFAEHIDIVFYTTLPDLSKITYVSPAYEKIWGRSCESLYKNPNDWFDAIIPEDRKIAHDSIFSGIKQGKVNPSAEFRIKRPDGTIRRIFSRIFQVRDELKHVFVVIGIAVDLTEITQEKIHKQVMIDLLRLGENETSITSFFRNALEVIARSLDLAFTGLWLVDNTNNTLRCVDTWHKNSKGLDEFAIKNYQHTFKPGEGFPGQVWKTKQPFFIEDYSVNKIYSRANDAKMAELNSAFGIPVIFQNNLYGVMEFFSNETIKPNERLLILLEQISKLSGEFILQHNAIEKIKQAAKHDLLTGLLNRSALEDYLTNLIAEEKSTSIVIMVVDIDRFKLINEALGHDVGDSVLKNVATRLSKPIKHKTFSLARLGADKFILCIAETDKQNATDYAREIHHRFKDTIKIDKHKISVSACIGVAIYPRDGLDSKSLVTNADLAMAQAKALGDNRIFFFNKNLPFIASRKISMDADLRQAMKNQNQFFLEFQPQVDLKTGNISNAESLIRWQHPVKGLIHPDQFIPFAEQNNLIVTLNELVMRMVFEQLALTRLDIPVSINISAQQLEDGFHLVEYLESLMNEFGITANQIELEITENMLVMDTEHNIAVLSALYKLGFQLAIDDFGTGFSSFSYFNRVPVYKIKIDRSFITGLPGNIPNAKIVKSMIGLAHALDMVVVAEGAETKAEVDFLIQEHCDMVQGFYYYKPMSIEDLKGVLSTDHT